MALIKNILFPVDFSAPSKAMGPFVKRAAALFQANVTLLHVFDPNSYTGLEVYVRGPIEIADEHRDLARKKLDAFLEADFPATQSDRILTAGDVASTVVKTAKSGFDVIMMPTHAGVFRRTLLGSTTAKVLNDADCPVVTSLHTETLTPHPLQHREWVVAIGLTDDSQRVLRFAHRAATEAGAQLRIIHAIQGSDARLPVRLDLEDQIQSEERRLALERIEALQQQVGSHAKVTIAVGPVKDALIEAIRRAEADGLFIGRILQPTMQGRLRDLTYAMVRDSPVPVISV